MKKAFYSTSVIVIFMSFITVSFTDKENTGIIFYEGIWQVALQKATAEHKPLFLDLSISWCGWCKKMKQNTYTNKKAGAYFNTHFINVELDAEQGEGLRLAQKFGVSGYPSVFIIDNNENAILSSEGYHDPDDLIKLVQSVMKE